MDARLKLTIPAEEIEAGAMKQIEDALALPYLKTLAIMPDVHQGYDLPIGGVALLDEHIWPGAVGYDIGCGMCHINTGATAEVLLHQREGAAQSVFGRILAAVPVGFNEHQEGQGGLLEFRSASGNAPFTQAVQSKAFKQLGTLGGGNHFIEVGVNSEGIVGITIHSGSRRPGWLIGDHYMRFSGGPVPVGSELGQAYLSDMRWALDFALANRATMMVACLRVLGLDEGLMSGMINENHNHAELTTNGVLHRKGATPAEVGQLGIIPANMRDGVWITEGLGNVEFLCSASHGAGRAMSRKQATRTLDRDGFSGSMQSIITPDLANLLDESPDAYKDIHGVIAAQDGILVKIVDHFKPLIVVKG